MKRIIEITLCKGCQSCLEETSPGVFESYDDHVLSQKDVTDAKEAELEALRSFSAAVILAGKKGVAIGENVNWISLFAKTSKLIDADGNPTPLLTGVNNKTADGRRLE